MSERANAASRRFDLPADKRELVERLLAAEGIVAGDAITPRENPNEYPLSFGQERLWFVDQLAPQNPAYNSPLVARVTGALDVSAFERAVREILRRHEVLRATFTKADGRPEQRIRPPDTVTLPVVDLQGEDDASRFGGCMSLIQEEVRRPFDLERGPLVRPCLFRVSEREHIFVLNMHHIVTDGWSLGVILRVLGDLYRDDVSNRRESRPDLPIQYADFAAWQRGQLRRGAWDHQITYWKQRLHDIPDALHLPFDHPRPPMQGFRGASEDLPLPATLAAKLNEFSRQEGVTLYMTLLAAFKAVLRQCSGQADIVVGTPVANRDRSEVENLVGFFVNGLALRTDLSGDPSLRELVARVRQVVLGAYGHQDLPFEQVVKEIHPERSLGRNPLFQTVFALETDTDAEIEVPGVTLRRLHIESQVALVDLTLTARETAGAVTVTLEYDTDLFDQPTAKDILRQYQTVLERMVADADGRLSTLPPFPRQTVASTPAAGAPEPGAQLDDIYERSNLTRNQLLVWMGQKLQPDVPLYNSSLTFHISGALDPARFRRAFRALLDQHDALRTVVEEREGVPRQRLLTDLPFEVEHVSFTSAADPEGAYRAWLDERRGRRFDMTERLFDSALIELGPDQFVWYLSQHQLITDGRSMSLLYERMAERYAGVDEAEHGATPDYPRFRDYVDRERAFHDSEQAANAKRYWREKLAGDLEALSLYGRNLPQPITRVRRVKHVLDADRSRRLRGVAGRVGGGSLTPDLALFNVLAGILFVYLHRISGNRRVALAAPFHNRRGEDRETVGLLMEVCPLQIEIEDEATFASIIKAVGVESREILRYARFGPGNPFQRKAYEVMLNYHNWGLPDFAEMPTRVEWVHSGHADEALTLQVHRFDDIDRLSLEFDFHCGVFPEEQQGRAIGHFLRILDHCLDDPHRPVAEGSLLSPEERERALFTFNQTSAPHPAEPTVVQLFEQQASKTPDATAVVSGADSLAYGELNARANQLAHYLHDHDVGPGTIVGVCLGRSCDLLVALWGVLKAGGAYLPMDPNYPSERLAFMLSDSGAALVLTDSDTRERLMKEYGDASESRVICVDAEWERIVAGRGQEGSENPTGGAGADDLVYVVYTSGSSGRPKGTMVVHSALLNAYKAWEAAYRLREVAQSHLQMASVSFDVFSGDLVRAHCSGAKLVMAPAEALLAPPALYELIQTEQVDCAEFVPAVFRSLLGYLEETNQTLNSMRVCVIGSDTWYVREYRRIRRLLPAETRLINSYGLTEATIDSTYFDGDVSNLPDDQLVPIGRPFANTQVYVLDRFRQPVPIGAPGELYVGGTGLARGYLNRPELTAERFVMHAVSEGEEVRLYRTGDLARYLDDGNIEFIGRADQQVKLRGFRIELGEIESALGQHPAVREAAVIVREDAPGEKRLVGYVVTGEDVPTVSDLRNTLKRRLPDYMVPSSFVHMDDMPRTPNGKLDRRALPAPGSARPELERTFTPPRTHLELQVAQIWSDVLGVERVGVDDNFFDLGGHSLLAIQVMSRLSEAVDVDMPPHIIFEVPTAGGLAGAILERQAAEIADESLSDLLAEVEALSDEQVRSALADQETLS